MRRGIVVGMVGALVAALLLVLPAAAKNSSLSRTERQFAGLLNKERRANGLRPVEISPALTKIAHDYVAENVRMGSIDHGRDAPYTRRTRRVGCGGWNGPVLAAGFGSAQAALDGWLSSSGHRAVLMDPKITHVGPGFKAGYALAYGLKCKRNRANTSHDFGAGFSR